MALRLWQGSRRFPAKFPKTLAIAELLSDYPLRCGRVARVCSSDTLSGSQKISMLNFQLTNQANMSDGLNSSNFSRPCSRLQEKWESLCRTIDTSSTEWNDDARVAFEEQHRSEEHTSELQSRF